jgi:hypothetical protein
MKLIIVFLLIVACAYAFNVNRLAEVIADMVESDTEASLCTTTAVNLRSGPCTSNSIITTLSSGVTINSLNEKKTACGYDWIKISANGKTGWIAAQYTKSCGGSSPSPSTGGQDCGEAFEQGRSLGRKTCVTIDGKPVVTTTAAAFNKMKAAASSNGVSLRLNSAFRTMKEQEYFYNCYLTKKCNNGNLAAKPGYSNHQNGIALDINTSGGAYEWLRKNGSKYGFVRTVASETWHWEYRPGSRCNAFVSYSCN